jgi:general secretion pathway protein D
MHVIVFPVRPLPRLTPSWSLNLLLGLLPGLATGCATATSSPSAAASVPGSLSAPFARSSFPSSSTKTLPLELADWAALENPLLPLKTVPIKVVSALAHKLNVDTVQAPLDALLFALADDAGLELELHANFSARITVRAHDQTLESVLQRVAQQQAMRWELRGTVLNVWGDTPYTATYAVDYLNIDRSTRSSVGLATRVGTINADASDVSGGIANNSQTLIENTAEHRFWHSLAADLDQLMSVDSDVIQQAFSLNRDVGLITLYASVASHQRLTRYLTKLNDSAQRQVLIEATVVEVTLSDRFEAGIDWQVLARGLNGISAAQVLTGAPLVNTDTVDRLVAPNGLVSFVQRSQHSDIGATLSMLEQFGDVRIMSRPRVIALNNQPSVLKVVDNRVYFTVNVERQRSDEQDEITTETRIHTVPVGLVMNVTPFISGDGNVMLNVRPTLSRILGFVNDPNPELAAAGVQNSVPEIQVREMETMLRVASGDVAIIGGLMQDTVEGSDRRLPGLGSLPVIRHLFSQRRRNRRQTELLIVLRPTVMAHPDA